VPLNNKQTSLSDTAIKDLIRIFNVLLSGCLPHNKYFFNKLLFDKVSKHFDTHVYCRDCGAYLSVLKKNVNVVLTCLECHVSAPSCELVKSGCSFVAYYLCTQLTTLFETTDIAKYMCSSYRKNPTDDIYDLVDGSEYKKQKISFPYSLSLTCNTDGVPVFSSSNSSLWPIYFFINELQLRMRNAHNAVMCSLAWFWQTTYGYSVYANTARA